MVLRAQTFSEFKSSGVRAAVMITTDKVYENPEDGKAFKEDAPLGGHDPYSASKAADEIVISSYNRSLSNSLNNVLLHQKV